MTNFIRDAACRGRQPQGVIPLRHISRPQLVNELLAERYSPRFLVAPAGFGKKTLMGEYAQVVFSFEHVFWICGTSPCFLRDLDAGTILSDLQTHDNGQLLVVFQDVPCLDERRADEFTVLIEELIRKGNEVICSLAPSADVYGGRLKDRVLLNGFGLLVTAEERQPRLVDEERPVAETLPPSSRIPCLVWGERGQLQLLEGLRREDIPQDLFLVASAILLVGRGEVSELECFLEKGRLAEAVDLLARDYPYTGLGGEGDTFLASPIAVGDFTQVISHSLRQSCANALCGNRDGMASRAANLLLNHGEVDRAFETMACVASQSSTMQWLGENSWTLVRAGYSKDYCVAFMRASCRHVPVPAPAGSAAAWSFAAMGDDGEAVRTARGVVASSISDDSSRTMAALLLAMIGSGEEVESADRAISAVARRSEAQQAMGEEPEVPAKMLDVLAVHAALQESPALAASVFEEQKRQRVGPAARLWPKEMLVSACLILSDIVRHRPALDAMAVEEAEALEDFVQDSVLSLDAMAAQGGALGWGHVQMGRLIQAVLDGRLVEVSLRLRSATESALKKRGGELAEEQGFYRRTCRQMESDKAARKAARADAFRPDTPDHPKTEGSGRGMYPPLKVNLFGSLSVQLGDVRLDEQLLARRKSRTLLALLVLNHGREVSVDYLASTFWPDARPAAARKNFYSIWALLRRVLSVEGECPYLIRTELSVRINYDLVETDLEPFEDLCRQLLFGGGGGTDWEELLALASGRFGGVLLPAERDNALIRENRRRMHTNITDALVAASGRLLDSGEPQGALWFAREALRRDQSREDIYLVQMRAQIAADQRAAALDTFFACRAYLTDQLGIDPSPALVGLYRSIIEEEVPF